MPRRINKIKLFVKRNKKSAKVASDLESKLKNSNFEIVDENYDLAISVGGDGSFLKAVRENDFNDNIYYIGVNSGSLGFLQEIDIQHTVDFVKKLNTDNYKVEEISIQETKITTDKEIYKFNSLNEVVIRSEDFDVLRTPIYVDDELFENFSGDGILLCTSTGSTAYNKSFGGSVVYNTLDTLSITPIAPLNNKVYNTLPNTVIVPSSKVVSLVLPKYNRNLFIQVDGINYIINNVVKVETKIGKRKIKCIRMNEFHFIKVLNNKMLEK